MKFWQIIIGLGILTWILLIISGLIIITIKLFNEDTVTLECPDVDLKKSHILDGITYVKLNAAIDKKVTKTERVIIIDNMQLGIAKMSIIMFWILILPLFIFAIYKALH